MFLFPLLCWLKSFCVRGLINQSARRINGLPFNCLCHALLEGDQRKPQLLSLLRCSSPGFSSKKLQAVFFLIGNRFAALKLPADKTRFLTAFKTFNSLFRRLISALLLIAHREHKGGNPRIVIFHALVNLCRLFIGNALKSFHRTVFAVIGVDFFIWLCKSCRCCNFSFSFVTASGSSLEMAVFFSAASAFCGSSPLFDRPPRISPFCPMHGHGSFYRICRNSDRPKAAAPEDRLNHFARFVCKLAALQFKLLRFLVVVVVSCCFFSSYEFIEYRPLLT